MSQASLDLARQLYDAVLGRDPNAGDQTNLATFLDAGSGGVTPLAGSAEANARLTAVDQQVLGQLASSTDIVRAGDTSQAAGLLPGFARQISVLPMTSGARHRGGTTQGHMPLLNAFIKTFLVGIAGAAAATIATVCSPNKAYPACDNKVAKTELAVLYDNRRLLHAIEVSDLRLLNNSLLARHCTATVRWGDGSVSEVNYEFDRSGRRSGHLSMWIDYNGGMRGPSFF